MININILDGSTLRGIDNLLSDARAQVSQVKLIVNDALKELSHYNLTDERGKELIEDLQTALALLTDLDDR